MRRHILTTLVIFAALLNIKAKGFDNFYNEHKNLSLKELKAKGNSYLEQNAPDSAVMCYRIITGKYAPSMSKQDIKQIVGAHINCGYVFSFYYSDFSQAYTDYQEAEDISIEGGVTSLLPYIYLNKGTIYANFGDSARVVKLYKQAFQSSIEEKNYDITLTAFTNLLQIVDCDEQKEEMLPILETFSKLDIPEQEMLQYTLCMKQAAVLMSEKQWDKAIETTKKAISLIDLKIQPERYEIACNLIIAQLYFKKKEYGKALEYYNNVLSESRGLQAYDCMNDGLAGLKKVYSAIGNDEKALDYKIQQIELRDSLFSSRSYAMICDMESTFEINKIENRVEQLEYEKRQGIIMILIISISAVIFLIMLVVIIKKNITLNDQNHILYEKNEELMKIEIKPQSSGAGPLKTDDKKMELLNKIMTVMKDIDVITREDFSLALLAELTDSKERYVSQVINEELQKNFSTWLGECRVKEACRRIKDTDTYGNITIEGIAQSLGFKSRSNFTTVFKKVTGLSPSEYQKQTRS